MTQGNPQNQRHLRFRRDDDYDEEEEDNTPLPQKVLDLTGAPKRISHVQFGMLSASDMERLAECPIHRRDLYTLPSSGSARAPAAGGCL